MIELAPSHLLFIEPQGPQQIPPTLDKYTRRMTAALRIARVATQYRGYHECACGVLGGSADLVVGTASGRFVTNQLAVHYLAHHRSEVPPGELAKVLTLVGGHDDAPSSDELVGRFRARRPAHEDPTYDE